MSWDWNTIFAWVNTPWITIGKTPITAGSILGLAFTLAFVWWFAALVERTLRRVALHGRSPETHSTVYAFTRLARYVVWIVGTLVGLTALGFELTNLAFLGGAIGIGVGFGLQNIFQNFISGIIILVEKTLKIGDYVDLQSGVRGTVTEISMRYSRITTTDGLDILVPNSEFINGRVTNWTFGNRYGRIRVDFGVAYGVDKDEVKAAALAAAAAVPGLVIDDAHPADVRLVNFGESSLDFQLVAWLQPAAISRPGGTKARFLWALETELTRRGIEMPFPQRDLHIRSGTVAVKIEKQDEEASAGANAGAAAKAEPAPARDRLVGGSAPA